MRYAIVTGDPEGRLGEEKSCQGVVSLREGRGGREGRERRKEERSGKRGRRGAEGNELKVQWHGHQPKTAVDSSVEHSATAQH